MERYRRRALAEERSKADGPPPLSTESSPEAVLDAAVLCTFPASDPISIDVAYSAATERELARRKRTSH
jgi:hypothetical protein